MLRCLATSKSHLGHAQRCGLGALSLCGRLLVRGHFQRITHNRASTFSTTHTDNADVEQVNASTKQGRTKAIHDFAFLVSERNAQLPSPQLRTPHDIKAFYRAIKTKGLLPYLSSEEMSTVIQLFASLSLLKSLPNEADEDTIGPFPFHPLTAPLDSRQVNGRRDHWAFVLLVARDKEAHGLTLTNSDNYWLMRAALEDASRMSSQDSSEGDLKQCLKRARFYYERIKSEKDSRWLTHRIYLSSILDYGGSKFADEVVVHLSNLLNWYGGLHSCLQHILWRVLAFPEGDISFSSKSRFLHALRRRLGKIRDVLPISQISPGSAGPESMERSTIYDALAIRDYLVDIVFSFKPGSLQALRYLRDIYSWVLFESRAALCAFNDGTYATSEEEDRAAWSNLVLLSLSFQTAPRSSRFDSAAVVPEQGLDGGVHSQAHVLGWTVICSLAALSSEMHLRSLSWKRADLPSAEGLQEIARTLWILWRKEEAWRAGAVSRPMSLICSTTTSFMALASLSGDSRLAVSLIRHISNSIIYPARFGGEAVNRNMIKVLAVHYTVLTITTGVGGPRQHSWNGIFGALRYAQLVPDDDSPDTVHWCSHLASTVLVYLAHVDSTLAHNLSMSSAQFGLRLEDDAILAIGRALVSDGHLSLAFEYVKDGRISGDAASSLLDSLLLNIPQRDDLRSGLLQLLLKLLTESSIHPTNSHAFETFVRACFRAGYVKDSIKVIEDIYQTSPSLLRVQFLSQLASALASDGRYRLLGRVLTHAWHKTSECQASIFRTSRFDYTGRVLSGNPKATRREITSSLPFSIYVWPVLRPHIPFHPRLARLDKKIISLKLSEQLQKAGKLDETTLERAVFILVNAGRITAALKLLTKHSPTISTKAGNIILGASLRPNPSRRARRQIRHASIRLKQLVKTRGFVPDRVTLNLLMKALMRWKAITPKTTLRALFDRFIMNGYPISDDVMEALRSPDSASTDKQDKPPPTPTPHTPFGTDAPSSGRDSIPVNLKALPSHISFTRHTRPLYKMFIKAFKVRGDKEAARRVAEVLKGERDRVMRERAVRTEARHMGRIRARERRERQRIADSKENKA